MADTKLLSILLVEDNPGDARLIKTFLGNGHHTSFDLRTAGRLSDALDEINQDVPDAILLDLGLPDSQGLESIDRVVSRCEGTPIIVLTGLDDEETALGAIQRGAQDYLAKGGFDEELLVRTIRYAIERAAAEKSIRSSQERYRNLFEQANEAVLVISDYVIRAANPEAERLFGWSGEELLGKRMPTLIHPDDREMVETQYQRRLSGKGGSAQYDFRVETRDGAIRWVTVSTGAVEWEGETATLALLTDITKRKKEEDRSARLLERQTATNELTLALGATTEATKVYRVLHEHACRLVKHDAMLLCAVDRIRSEIQPVFAAIEGMQTDVDVAQAYPLNTEGELLQRAVLEGKPQVIADCDSEHDVNNNDCKVCQRGVPRLLCSAESTQVLEVRSKILVPMMAEGEAIGVLQFQSRYPNAFMQEEIDLLAGLANVAAIAVRNSQLVQESQEQARHLKSAFDGIIQTMSNAIETRDPYTAGHQQRVARIAAAIAETLGLGDSTIEGVRVAGLVHDIGKLGIPAEILSKPGKLSDIEFEIVRSHAEAGFKILESVDLPWPIAEIVHQHHERLDGSGYPQGLAGEDLLIEARIIGVADVVEAMASHRPYRPALGIDCALDEIEAHKRTRFDPQAVEACQALFRERGFSLDVTSNA
jgi:PAS domain S-box-containing protein/putative nucleotidyltransferase with HDIG domain